MEISIEVLRTYSEFFSDEYFYFSKQNILFWYNNWARGYSFVKTFSVQRKYRIIFWWDSGGIVGCVHFCHYEVIQEIVINSPSSLNIFILLNIKLKNVLLIIQGMILFIW